MLKLMLTGAVAARCVDGHYGLGAERPRDPYTFALVPKNTNNPFQDQALAGCKKAEAETEGRGEVPLYRTRRAWRRRRRGPDRSRPCHQEGRWHRRLARQRPGHGQRASRTPSPNKIPVLTWDSDLLPQDKGLRARLYRHAQL